MSSYVPFKRKEIKGVFEEPRESVSAVQLTLSSWEENDIKVGKKIVAQV